jgi:dethiobiotin synthetase
VTENQTVLDLLPKIDCRPLLVARAGLGTINHTLLSIEALRRRALPPLGVVLVQSEGSPDALALVDENMEAIARYAGIQTIGTIPFLSDFSAARDIAAAHQVLKELLS